MKITQENRAYYQEALKVDFLTEKWEVDLYTVVLIAAAMWGKKKSKEDNEYYKKHDFLKNYNT